MFSPGESSHRCCHLSPILWPQTVARRPRDHLPTTLALSSLETHTAWHCVRTVFKLPRHTIHTPEKSTTFVHISVKDFVSNGCTIIYPWKKRIVLGAVVVFALCLDLIYDSVIIHLKLTSSLVEQCHKAYRYNCMWSYGDIISFHSNNSKWNQQSLQAYQEPRGTMTKWPLHRKALKLGCSHPSEEVGHVISTSETKDNMTWCSSQEIPALHRFIKVASHHLNFLQYHNILYTIIRVHCFPQWSNYTQSRVKGEECDQPQWSNRGECTQPEDQQASLKSRN